MQAAEPAVALYVPLEHAVHVSFTTNPEYPTMQRQSFKEVLAIGEVLQGTVSIAPIHFFFIMYTIVYESFPNTVFDSSY